MSIFASWDKITGALGSTNTTFGGNWGNLISDFMNGIDVGLSDPTKRPRPNTLTRWKHEKFGLFDGDESHHVLFSVNDIDTGSDRKIVIRRMNSPNETDYMVMENMTQTLKSKSIDSDLNTFSNIKNSDIKIGAGITDNKLAQITDKSKLHSSIVYTDQANSYGSAVMQTFRSQNIRIANPAVSFYYRFVTSAIAAGRDITLPLLTTNDQFTFDAHTTTLTNKTLNATDNTITDTSTAAGDIFKSNGTKFTRLPRGTANQILRVNSAGTDLEYGALPTASLPTHASTHMSAGSDPIRIDELKIGTDVTTLNATTTEHGLLPKLGGGSTNFLRADGTWAAPPGTGGGESNTGSNVGTGEGSIFRDKTTTVLNFKTLKQGTNITITNNADDVTIAASGGGGGGAPTDAQYITLATDATLSAERVLTAGTNITINDGGANGAATLNVPDASTSTKGVVELATSAETTAGLAVQASDTRLSDSRTPTAHNHSGADITTGTVAVARLPDATTSAKGISELATDGEVAANVVVQGNDSRLVRDLYEEMKTRTQVGEVDIQDAGWGSGMFVTQPTFIGNNTGWGDDADGLYRYYGTGTTSGTKAGNITTSNIFRRQFKPHLFFIFKLFSSTTNHAMFIGLSSVNTAAETHATAPLANISGIGLVVLTNQANYQIAHNSGGATATLVNTGIAKGTTIKSCEIKNANNDSTWAWNLNDGEASGTITTNVPAETTDLYATWHNINASTTDHYLYLYKMLGKVSIL